MESDILHVNFNGIQCKDTHFDDSDLYFSRFIKARLEEVGFTDCNLKAVNYSNSNMSDVSFKYSNYEDAQF
jgi:uncharacterized protein YjbI with pentapeptide repeats